MLIEVSTVFYYNFLCKVVKENAVDQPIFPMYTDDYPI